MQANRGAKIMDMPAQGYAQAQGSPGTNFVQVTPPAGFGVQGNGKSDMILTTNDPKGLFFDFNRDNVLYGIDGLINHVRSGGKR